MKNQPLLMSIFIGIIVVFVVVGASLVAKLSNVNKRYKNELLKNVELEEERMSLKTALETEKEINENLKSENKESENVIKGLRDKIANLTTDIEKLEKSKEKLQNKVEQLQKEQEKLRQTITEQQAQEEAQEQEAEVIDVNE